MTRHEYNELCALPAEGWKQNFKDLTLQISTCYLPILKLSLHLNFSTNAKEKST
jgi:hypothetical protein